MTIRYLNETVFCTLAPSPIHGIGVFAIRDIPEGTMITDHTVETMDYVERYMVSPDEFNQIHPAIQKLILDRTVFGDMIFFHSPNSDAVLRSFMNHSSDPNSDGVIALRDIREGEEVTEDFTTLVVPHDITRKHMPFVWK